MFASAFSPPDDGARRAGPPSACPDCTRIRRDGLGPLEPEVTTRQAGSSPQLLRLESLEQARLVRVSLPEFTDPLRGLVSPAGPTGKIAQVHQQGDRPVVVLGTLRVDQLFDFTPRGRLAAGQLIQVLGPRLGLLPLAAGPFPGRLFGRLAGLPLGQGVAC